jgi:hypothetical protein
MHQPRGDANDITRKVEIPRSELIDYPAIAAKRRYRAVELIARAGAHF